MITKKEYEDALSTIKTYEAQTKFIECLLDEVKIKFPLGCKVRHTNNKFKICGWVSDYKIWGAKNVMLLILQYDGMKKCASKNAIIVE